MSSLYTICLNSIYGFLKEGMWKSCILNPFSDFPTKFVNELMDLSDDGIHSPKICDVLLLLTSGRLTRLDFCPFNPKAEQDLTVTVTQKTGSICLRNLPSNSEEFIFHFVRNIISCNPHLEEFYSYVNPGLDIFLKCPNIRIIHIRHPDFGYHVNNAPIDLSVLSSLSSNLEIFHVFNIDTDTIAKVLETCPKLASIGQTYSLDCLEAIAQRRQKNSLLNLDVDRHFQLRFCFWGEDHFRRDEISKKRQEKNSRFGVKISSAVELCPLLQGLVIHVHKEDDYEALRFLKQLTYLRIHFVGCRGDFLSDFVSLLQEIGPQLKHLTVFGQDTRVKRNHWVPVDVICDCCPTLQNLEIFGSICMKDSSKSSSDLTLKRLTLHVMKIDREVEKSILLFLLCNSKHVEEFYLETALSLDDTLLNQIFERNPFSQLKMVYIERSSLTREGFQMFVEKSASIETVLIRSLRQETHFYDAIRFKNANPSYSKNSFAYVRLKAFFYDRRKENASNSAPVR